MIGIEELREALVKITIRRMHQAEILFSGSKQGPVKLEYVVNLVIDELKKFPLPIYLKIMIVVFQFAFKSEIRQDVQELFNGIKDEINSINNPEKTPAAVAN